MRFKWFLITALGFALAGSPASAAEYYLEPVVVTATRTPIPADRSSANVTVLTAEEIRRLPARNAAEALSNLPGVVIDHSGGLGSQATASIYGSETRHVAVYLDGVPLNILANPMTDLAKIPLDWVDRIEIHKGTASSAWGSALGGVIHIITREPKTDRAVSGRAGLTYGDHQTLSAEAGIEGRAGKTSYLITAHQTRSDGFNAHRDLQDASLYLKIKRQLADDTALTLAAGLDDSDKDAPNLFRPGRWERGTLTRSHQSLALTGRASDRWSFDVNVHHQDSDSDLEAYYETQPRQTVFTYVEQTWGVSAKAQYDSAPGDQTGHILSLGYDGDWGTYNYSPLGRDMTARNQAFWLSDVLSAGPWSLNMGGRWDDNQDFGGQFSPSAGVVYRLERLPALVRFQWARGFSAPPLSYLYDPWAGNPDLGPERGDTWQLGGEADIGRRVRIGLNLFRADLEDMIYYDPGLGYVVNLDEVRRTGAEMSVHVDLGAGFTAILGGTWVEVWNLRTDEEVPNIPTRIYDLGLRHRLGGFSQSLTGRWTDYNSPDPETRDKLMVWDYLASYAVTDPITLRLAVHNLTDETEHHYWYLPRPGRWAEIGVVWSF